jgi:phosphate transport system protein
VLYPRTAAGSTGHRTFIDHPQPATWTAYRPLESRLGVSFAVAGATQLRGSEAERMRDAYHEQLDDILVELERMTRTVSTAVRRSTRALLAADIKAAEEIIAADIELDASGEGVEDRVFELMARQSPVANELRMLVAALRMVADLERMGDLAAHVAKVARMRYPQPAIPPELSAVIGEMGAVAEAMVNAAGDVIKSRDVSAAQALESTDDKMDKLRTNQFRMMMDDSWPHSVEVAVDIALLGRYYERIADHAVSMARRVVYLVTGELPVAIGGTAAGSGAGAATPPVN